jgi:hypothetical protein
MSDGLIDGGGDEEEVPGSGHDEFLFDAVLDHVEKRAVILGDVEQDDGFVVIAELAADDDLGDFFEGSETAGESDESVAALFEHGFAVAHVGGDDELVGFFVGEAVVVHELGGDADDFPAGVAGGLGDGIHEADGVSAVDEGPAFTGDGGAKLGGCGEIDLGDGGSGGAEDGDGFDHDGESTVKGQYQKLQLIRHPGR